MSGEDIQQLNQCWRLLFSKDVKSGYLTVKERENIIFQEQSKIPNNWLRLLTEMMTKNGIPKIKGSCWQLKLLSTQAELRVPFCRLGIHVTTSSPSYNEGNTVL